MEDFIQYVRRRIPSNWKSNSGGWVSGNCPMCVKNGQPRPDTRGRGGFRFSVNEFGYNCFNCGYTIRWSPGSRISHKLKSLLYEFGAEKSEIQRFVLRNLQSEEYAQRELAEKIRYEINWPTSQLPEESVHITECDPDSRYVSRALRLIHDRQLEFHSDWYYSNNWKWKRRLILPLRYESNIVGYAARDLTPNPKQFKYLIETPKNFVYGLDKQTENKKITIVTEGYIDAIVTDGVAIGSNQLNDDQADIIEDLHKDIILLPDRNAAGAILAERAIEYGWKISFPPWDRDVIDANDAMIKYGRYFTVHSIIKFAEANSTKQKVLTKQYCKD